MSAGQVQVSKLGQQHLVRPYIMLIALLAIGSGLIAVPGMDVPSVDRLILAAALMAVVALVTRLPFHFEFKMNVVLDTAVIFTAALVLPPALAVLVAGGGCLVGQILRGVQFDELVFNSAQTALQAGVAALILASLGWQPEGFTFERPVEFLAVTLAALSIYLVNTIAVSIVIGLQTGLDIPLLWRQTLTRHDGIEQASQFVVGLIAAILVDFQLWTLPLFAFPMLVVYHSLDRQYALREKTVTVIQTLADLVDKRDPYTADHSRRVAGYTREIATAMGLDPSEVSFLERVARVHDIGKIVIESETLTKAGPLNDDEWGALKRHPVTGSEMLAGLPEFDAGLVLIRSHHERIDGMGYPDGLTGDKIPLGARIMALADGFDAMASARPYRGALPPETVLAELERGRGTQWDADAVDTLLSLIESGRIVLSEQSDHPQIVDGAGFVPTLRAA